MNYSPLWDFHILVAARFEPYILFFTQTLSYPHSLSSLSTFDDYDDYTYGSLSSSSPSFSDSFDSYHDFDEDATFSFTFSVTISSETIPILADFSPTEPPIVCAVQKAFLLP